MEREVSTEAELDVARVGGGGGEIHGMLESRAPDARAGGFEMAGQQT